MKVRNVSGLGQTIKRLSQSSIVHVACAFIAMGSWAIFANRAHPMPEPIIAGLVQGALSGTITLVMKKALEALLAFFLKRKSEVLALIAPPLFACSVSLIVLYSVHYVAQTPEIIPTIALPFTVALVYACLYTFGLWASRRHTYDAD